LPVMRALGLYREEALAENDGHQPILSEQDLKPMRLVTYRASVEAEARLGAIDGDLVVDLEKLGQARGVALPSTMLAFIDLGPQAVSAASALMAEAKGLYPVGVASPLSNAKLLAPI